MANVVTNVNVKFNCNRLRIDKALGNFLKSDNNNNNNNNNNNTVNNNARNAWEPFLGPKISLQDLDIRKSGNRSISSSMATPLWAQIQLTAYNQGRNQTSIQEEANLLSPLPHLLSPHLLLPLLSFPILSISYPSLPSSPFPFPPILWPPPLPLEVGPLNLARGFGWALWAPTEGSGAEPQPKSNFVHISLKIWQLVATIFDDFAENRLTKFRAFFHPAVFCRDNDACRFERVTKLY